MNIYARWGTKVVFSRPDAGYPDEQKRARKHLKVGKTYTVKATVVHGFHTDVFLEEAPGVAFNSVQFTDSTDRS